MREKEGSEGGREGRWRETIGTQRGGGRARWNLNVPKPEQEQLQHHNRRHLLSQEGWRIETEREGGLFLICIKNFTFYCLFLSAKVSCLLPEANALILLIMDI